MVLKEHKFAIEKKLKKRSKIQSLQEMPEIIEENSFEEVKSFLEETIKVNFNDLVKFNNARFS